MSTREKLIPFRFISEPVEVEFDLPPALEKKPGCPDRFLWKGEVYSIMEVLAEWQDFQRRGRMSSNMRPSHSKIAEGHGSWGVGQFYYRIRTNRDRFFDLYYDRAPKGVDRRKGGWFLYQELALGDLE